jgi:adenylate cyclase
VGDTLRELADWARESIDDLREWRRFGLLPDEPDRSLAQRLERVRLIRFAVDRGYPAERLAQIANAHGDMIGPFAEQIGAMAGEPVCTLEEAAGRAGLDPELLASVMASSGLPQAGVATQAEIEAAALIKVALDNGQPPEILAQLIRVFSDSLNRVADASVRMFHLHVHEPMRAESGGGAELLEATIAIAAPFMALMEPAVVYLHRKALEQAFREDMMLHLSEEATAPSAVRGEITRAILFADLSSFTPLAEVMGDSAAAGVVSRFSEMVRSAVGRSSGQIVKQIGDEFMVVFPDGRAAVRCGLDIRTQAADEPRFPALRMGAHVGPVLYREGDYVGTNINIASRVTNSAGRNEFLVTDAVRRQLADLEVDLVPVGPRSLKGLSEPVELFEVRHEGGRDKAVDPVCGMQLDDGSSEAQLNWHGHRVLFCSEGCLRRFLEEPARYVDASAPAT